MDTEHVRRLGSFVLSKCSTLFLALTPYFREMVQKTGILHNLTALSVKGQTPVNTNLSNIISSCPKLKCLHVLFGLNVTVDTRKVSEKLPKLERLSICCQPEHGPPKIVNGIALLHNLTHLTVPVCALIEKLPDKEIKGASSEVVYTGGFKKRRVGITQCQSNAAVAAFNLVFDNCPHIVMLEIGFNTSTSCSPAKVLWECLENIKKLKGLTHLTLDGVPITNGNFLIVITRECTNLKFLRLRSLGPSGKCVYLSQLIQALAYCKNLVNLRIQQNYLAPGTNIWKALEACNSLQRVFISSERDTQALDLNALATLIDKQTNLVFVFVVGANTSKEKCTNFTRKYKKLVRPALVVRVRNILYDVFDEKNTDNRTTPACHYNEMVTFRSWAFDYVP
ncbi:F-box/LRR-repeat protein 18 [Penaeus vannamei]|uniref:F-box/LRR-repeat protein 18 n=3 Tax=Penaeus vannamei TaxID=6689 RepID=A0A423TMJ4_PENVA|nr:F-box/LRR-repeat protein 18 [Penaeus vannamei]